MLGGRDGALVVWIDGRNAGATVGRLWQQPSESSSIVQVQREASSKFGSRVAQTSQLLKTRECRGLGKVNRENALRVPFDGRNASFAGRVVGEPCERQLGVQHFGSTSLALDSKPSGSPTRSSLYS